MDSLQGHFLVASPRLPDSNFFRAVVLIIQHDEEGAFGVILNRPTSNTVGEVLSMVDDLPSDNEQPINVGGPVAGPLLAIHMEEEFSENQIIPGVHLATHKDFLTKVVRNSLHPYRVFSGYAGWAGGQLEGELEMGGWLTTPASVDDIFDLDEDLWKRVSRQFGMDILKQLINADAVPEDPSVN